VQPKEKFGAAALLTECDLSLKSAQIARDEPQGPAFLPACRIHPFLFSLALTFPALSYGAIIRLKLEYICAESVRLLFRLLKGYFEVWELCRVRTQVLYWRCALVGLFEKKMHDEFHWLSGGYADDSLFYVADYFSLPDSAVSSSNFWRTASKRGGNSSLMHER
jgi:hypothetical protein